MNLFFSWITHKRRLSSCLRKLPLQQFIPRLSPSYRAAGAPLAAEADLLRHQPHADPVTGSARVVKRVESVVLPPHPLPLMLVPDV